MSRRHRLGRLGEDAACAYLQMLGMEFLSRNFRRPGGEVDLVMAEGRVVVFVEVKTRTGNAVAAPEEFVTLRQLACLRRAARHWLAVNPDRGGACRFDVVAVEMGGAGRELLLRHFRAVG
jgi:putative endonuclease